MLINEESENVDAFGAVEKAELIFHLFKIFAVGGIMSQPDTEVER